MGHSDDSKLGFSLASDLFELDSEKKKKNLVAIVSGHRLVWMLLSHSYNKGFIFSITAETFRGSLSRALVYVIHIIHDLTFALFIQCTLLHT